MKPMIKAIIKMAAAKADIVRPKMNLPNIITTALIVAWGIPKKRTSSITGINRKSTIVSVVTCIEKYISKNPNAPPAIPSASTAFL